MGYPGLPLDFIPCILSQYTKGAVVGEGLTVEEQGVDVALSLVLCPPTPLVLLMSTLVPQATAVPPPKSKPTTKAASNVDCHVEYREINPDLLTGQDYP